MTVRDQVMAAAEKMLDTKPYDQITFAEIAREAGVHWTAVRRHFGGKRQMREWLKARQAEESRFADTRTCILEAGQRMFAELGYAQASLDKVAAAAGLTKGAVYWHFSGKQDLFLAILEHSLQKQLRQLPGQAERWFAADDPETALAEWLEAQFACLERETGGPRLFLEFVVSSRESDVRGKLREVHGRIIDGAGAMIEEMQRKGAVSPRLDPQAVSLAVDALLKGYVIEWLIDPARCESPSFFRTAARLLWKGLEPRK
jgi:AcrR family transcriptional regulator